MMIGELATRSGLTQSRIRFYEAIGLLPGTERCANGYRLFKPENLQMLELIRYAQQAGFTLHEIRALLPTSSQMDRWAADKMLDILQRKIAQITAMQKRLAKDRAQLQAVVRTIENKPTGMSCLTNMTRVVELLRHGNARFSRRRR